MPKIIFANFVNKVMTSVPGEAHVRALTAPAARKIWFAQEGDLIVLPGSPDSEFLEYACSLTDVRRDLIKFVVPKGALDGYLADRLSRDKDAFSSIEAFCRENEGVKVDAFAQDEPTVAFFQKIGAPIEGYDSFPSASTIATISRLNTKSGFKDFAAGLGIKFVQGEIAFGVREVIDSVTRQFDITGSVVVKIDRGSNGFGHWVVSDRERIKEAAAHLLPFYEQGDRFIVEPQLNFISTPSVEFNIDNSGPSYTRTIDMRCINNAWRGHTSPQPLLESIKTELLAWGSAAADYLFHKGYRGPFDIDCGMTADGTLYATEANCRHTGSTNISFLLKRLTGCNSDDLNWLADNRVIKSPLTFRSVLRTLEVQGLAWDKSANEGIILTANTVVSDNKWRYLIVSREFDGLLRKEEALLQILGGE